MSPPIPVPSKAAIHALRGLALGTSCAIGLIVEDRRRRISTLRTAIDNKKKLRTSRKFHGAAEAVNYAATDAAILSGDELHWHYRDTSPKDAHRELSPADRTPAAKVETEQQARGITTKAQPAGKDEPVVTNRPIDAPLGTRDQPRSQIPGLSSVEKYPRVRDSGGWASTPGARTKPKKDNRIAKLAGLSSSRALAILKEPGAFATYKAEFLSGCQMKFAFKKKPTSTSRLDPAWMRVAANLCLHCREHGLWQDAQDILAAVVKLDGVSEEEFYSLGPISIIESLLSTRETEEATIAKHHLAVQLFLTKFDDKPRLYADEVRSLGQALITNLIQLRQPKFIHPVYWRVLGQLEEPAPFTAWYMQSLFDSHDHKSVVKYYKVNFNKLRPDPACFESTVGLVVNSVKAMRGIQAVQVTHALAKHLEVVTDLRLKSGWLIQLLESHWDRHQDLQQSRDLFEEMISLGLMDKIDDPEQVYQIIVKLSVLAGDEEAAHHYYQKTIMIAPQMAENVWLNGYIALMKAKNNDWDGVFNDFSAMRKHSKRQQKALGQTFAAVLKVFIDGHTISESENFIKTYMEKMDVEFHRYSITLMANKYGQLRDHKGFLGWLQYCSSQGLALDSAFTNAILRNFRREWHFPHDVLRKLYTAIRRLDRASVDTVTTRIMHSAAMEEGNYSGTSGKRRIRMLGASPSKLPYLFRSANERDVLHAMTEELVVRENPLKAITIYKRALSFGMPWCPKCFRLAVKASLQQKGESASMAARLISEAHEQGHDVTAAAALFLKTQITQNRGSFPDVLKSLQTLVANFEAIGVLIDPSVLTHSAIMSAQFKQFDRAINLCNFAMEKSGTTNPCFSRQSLRALLMSYWQTLDTDGMRWIVESLPSSPLASDTIAFKLLKSTRRHMEKWKPSARVEEFKGILQSGIDQMKRTREVHIEIGSNMHKETLGIIKDAARLSAGEQHEQRARGTRNVSRKETHEVLPLDMRPQISLRSYG